MGKVDNLQRNMHYIGMYDPDSSSIEHSYFAYSTCTPDIPLATFHSLYITNKISECQYEIIEIIRHELPSKVMIGDIIDVNNWWITYKITRGDNHILSGTDGLYIKANAEFSIKK